MQINKLGINDTKSSTQNFKGYVGKSVFNHMNAVKNDIAKTKNKDDIVFFIKEMPDILTKLKTFMSSFHKDTSLEFKQVSEEDKLLIVPFFKNKKTKTKFNAYSDNYRDRYVDGVGINGINVRKTSVSTKNRDLFGRAERWDLNAVKGLKVYVDQLTETIVNPSAVDKKLFNIMIENMEETANLPMAKIIGNFLAKKNGKKADKLAPEFGLEPKYTESFLEKTNKARKDEKARIIEENSIKNLLKSLEKIEIK